MGTEVIAVSAAGEDKEEGEIIEEIIDVEAYENNMELESISSEEEENLKDRIRELETRNKELEKLAAVAKEERRTYNYDNSDFVTISSEEEEYFEPRYSKLGIRMVYPNGRRNSGIGRGKSRRANLRYKSPEKFRSNNVSPDYKRRRRSMSPDHYPRPKNDHTRERPKYDQYRGREHKKKKKRSMKRQHSDTESDNENFVRSQLNAAVKRGTRVSIMHVDNPLMRKLKLRPGSANKENEQSTNGDVPQVSEKHIVLDEEEEDDELIALRLQALKSKQEVKELIQESTLPSSIPLPDVKSDDFDQEELELRMIALKSAIVKKADARKRKNEKPYSPTDGLEWTPASPDNPYASSESNMQISPAISPTLDDAVLQPIDMEIATPEHISNSPTFYSFDETSTKLLSNQMEPLSTQDFTNPWASVIPAPAVIVPVVFTQQVVPMMPKTTKNGVPLEFLSQPIRDELSNCRSHTQSPCSEGTISDINSNLRPRSRSLDSLRIDIQSTKDTEAKKSPETKKETVNVPATPEDDEERALRTLLLAKMSSTSRQPKEIVPLMLKSSTIEDQLVNNDKDIDNIEGNLKRAASRFKELSEHEEELIEANLDKILSNSCDGSEIVEKKEEEKKKVPIVSLKDVVQRLKLSQAKEKLLKVTDEPMNVECKIEIAVIHEVKDREPENVDPEPKDSLDKIQELPKDSPVEIQEPLKDILAEVQEPPKDCESSPEAVPEKAGTVLEEQFPLPESPKPYSDPAQESKPEPVKVVSKPVKIPSTSQTNAVAHLKPKQITKAMSSIVAATLPKPKTPPVLTMKHAPVIMKRKLKTNSSIINVPFQHKSTGNSAAIITAKPSSANTSIPSASTSATIVSLESVIKPVPQVIIRLGQSSSEDSDTDSDMDTESENTNEAESAIASPSHITEYNDVVVPSPNTAPTNTTNELPKVDPLFETKLDEFLKLARAKAENVTPKSDKVSRKVVPKPVQKTPSAVRHLPLSSQIEYNNLLAKMKILEKQKQSRLKSQLTSKVPEVVGDIKVIVENDAKKPENSQQTPQRKVLLMNKEATVTRSTSESSDTFETRLSKMSEEQKEKALEKYETTYNDFSLQFETQLGEYMEKITDAKVEKRKQIQLEMEAEELRAKLAAVESQLGHQREKVKKIYPKISASHKKVLESRDKYLKMGKCCTKLGQSVKGTDYQFKNEAKEMIAEKLKQLPMKTKQLKNVKEEYLKELSEKTESANVKEPTTNHNSYQSVLDCMSTTKTGTNSNHDGVLCPFDLSGKCSDKECKYVHLS